MPATTINILALDVGERRIGVAAANTMARLARPLGTLINEETVWPELTKLVESEDVKLIVIGLPRSLDSADTAQTRYVRSFADEVAHKLVVNTVFQDEALTSRQAEAELRSRGKHFAKGDIDALAATYILDDYLRTLDRIDTT